jgi:hypothetical protein
VASSPMDVPPGSAVDDNTSHGAHWSKLTRARKAQQVEAKRWPSCSGQPPSPEHRRLDRLDRLVGALSDQGDCASQVEGVEFLACLVQFGRVRWA